MINQQGILGSYLVWPRSESRNLTEPFATLFIVDKIQPHDSLITMFQIISVSPHFHWQKSFATKKYDFFETKIRENVQWPILRNSHAYPFCKGVLSI